jgi:hypothetical protein
MLSKSHRPLAPNLNPSSQLPGIRHLLARPSGLGLRLRGWLATAEQAKRWLDKKLDIAHVDLQGDECLLAE